MNNAMNLGIGVAQASGAGSFDDWDGKLTSLFRKKPSQGVVDAYKARDCIKTLHIWLRRNILIHLF